MWMKMRNGNKAWGIVVQFQGRTFSSHLFYYVLNSHHEGRNSVP